MGCSTCRGGVSGSRYRRYLRRRMLQGLRGDCYAGFPGRPDPERQECWANTPIMYKGLSGLGKLPSAVRSFLKCLGRAIDSTERIEWDEEFHNAFYSKVRTTHFGTDEGGAGMFPEAFGADPAKAAQIVANYPTWMLDDGDSFWDCIGIPKTDAAASVANREGAYYDLMNSVGLAVYYGEGGVRSGSARLPKGAGVAAIVITAAGVGGLMFLGRKGRR